MIQETALAIRRAKRIKKILLFLNVNTILVGGGIFIGMIVIGALLGGLAGQSNQQVGGGRLPLSETTLQWQDEVQMEAQKQGVPELVPYIMAIIQVESQGVGTDIMQSSESAGLPPNAFTDPLQSIEQGIKYLKNGVVLGESLGFTDFWGIVQSYNFGTAYVSHLATKKTPHSIGIAEAYSRDVVGPSLGNTTGLTYSYVNAVSQSYGKTYLYANAGNYYYADLVRQYVGSGSGESVVGSETYKLIMGEALKYEGNPYVWGGGNPAVGFDCSGLTQWVYQMAGITLPRVASDQYGATVPVSIEDAQPGDLIFFKGTYGAPEYISHVGIYVDESRMFDANDSGVGYHYWSSGYWQQHFAGIRRVVK